MFTMLGYCQIRTLMTPKIVPGGAPGLIGACWLGGAGASGVLALGVLSCAVLCWVCGCVWCFLPLRLLLRCRVLCLRLRCPALFVCASFLCFCLFVVSGGACCAVLAAPLLRRGLSSVFPPFSGWFVVPLPLRPKCRLLGTLCATYPNTALLTCI